MEKSFLSARTAAIKCLTIAWVYPLDFAGRLKTGFVHAAWLFAALLPLSACNGPGNENSKPSPQEAITVRLLRITPQNVSETYVDSGILAGKEEAVVTSAVTGEIVEIRVEEGAMVEKGGILAVIDPADYRLALQKAKAVEQAKRRALNRAKDLFARKAISKSLFDDAETDYKLAQTSLQEAKLSLSRTKIRSPISGQVTRKDILLGDRVNPGTPFFRVVNTDLLKLTISLSEKEVVHLKQEEEVILYVDAYPGEPFAGRVRSVRISPEPTAASFPVEIEVQNFDKLKPGMIARVRLRGQTYRDLLLVPTESIIERIGFYYMFVYEKGHAFLREVEPGRRFGDLTEIVKGLKPGDYIVPVYSSSLTDGSPVNVIGPDRPDIQPG